MPVSIVEEFTFFTGATDGDSSDFEFDEGDVIMLAVAAAVNGGTQGQYAISHPETGLGGSWNPVHITSSTGTTQFSKIFWQRASAASVAPGPITIDCAAGLGHLVCHIIRIPAAETAGTLVQTADTLEQDGINGGSSPLLRAHSFPTPTQSNSVNIAIWAQDVSGGTDAMAPRSSPAWSELAEKHSLPSGHGLAQQIQVYVGSDDESECTFTAGGGSGAPKVRSLLFEFEGVAASSFFQRRLMGTARIGSRQMGTA